VPAKKTAPKTTRTTRTAAAKAATPRAKPAAPAKVRAARAAKAAAAAKPSGRPQQRTRRKSLIGNVIADRTPKTVIVEVMRQRSHPLYGKVIRLRERYPTHDPNEDARLGDLVRIEEGRPFSATKRFRVAEILSRAGEAGAAATQVATAASALEELEGVTAVLPTKKDEEADEAEEGQDEGRS